MERRSGVEIRDLRVGQDERRHVQTELDPKAMVHGVVPELDTGRDIGERAGAGAVVDRKDSAMPGRRATVVPLGTPAETSVDHDPATSPP